MSHWNAEHYLKYSDERTRPAADLAARVQLNRPNLIADLGCGPGNSTQVLRNRWPHARVLGIDNSPEMIQAAQRAFPQQEWVLGDAAQWTPDRPLDLVFSNAVLQWIPDHDLLIRRLYGMVAPGGALAFQIPSATFARVRTLIHELSYDPAWTERMHAARSALTFESPAFYYDVLATVGAAGMDVWETEYHHVLDSHTAIVDWIASTGLRPFLAALESNSETNAFLQELQRRAAAVYAVRADGKVLFPFRRTFVIAYRC
jgi:trans-aconitate 2-methyltransferase